MHVSHDAEFRREAKEKNNALEITSDSPFMETANDLRDEWEADKPETGEHKEGALKLFMWKHLWEEVESQVHEDNQSLDGNHTWGDDLTKLKVLQKPGSSLLRFWRVASVESQEEGGVDKGIYLVRFAPTTVGQQLKATMEELEETGFLEAWGMAFRNDYAPKQRICKAFEHMIQNYNKSPQKRGGAAAKRQNGRKNQ